MNNKDLDAEFLQYASIVKLTEGQEMTGVEIAAAIAGLKNGIDLFKSAASAKDAATNSHFVHVIASMELQLSNLETEIASKNRELIAKDKEIDQLKEQLASIDKPKLVDQLMPKGSHWFVKNDESQIPVCRNCTDKANRIVYAIKTGIGNQCPECKAPI
jgi:hypothetical protein